jgi:para-aminobenzoate synthetase component 1
VFSVGGGIVFDSDPPSEFEETLHKGRTLMSALHASSAEEANAGTVWHNGAFKPIESASVPVDCEGFSYGLGFFETLRVQAGRPILLEAHLERFERTWREFFPSPPPDVTWSEVIGQLIRRNGLSSAVAVVKLVAAAGKSGDARAPYVLFASAKPYAPRSLWLLEGAGAAQGPLPGLRLRVYPHHRHTHLASHKTLNYMFYKLAGDWARRHGADEALILNADRSVSETNTANVCCVFGSSVCFPASEHALPGTMAAEVRRLLPRWGFGVEERRLEVEDLLAADQVFLTNSLMGAVPALSLQDAKLRYDPALCDEINEAVFTRSSSHGFHRADARGADGGQEATDGADCRSRKDGQAQAAHAGREAKGHFLSGGEIHAAKVDQRRQQGNRRADDRACEAERCRLDDE